MKKRFFSFALLLSVLSLTGCTPYTNHSSHDDGVVTAPTGYWYLNENGERAWRVITPGSLPEKQPLITKNYPNDMGNGSGR